MERDTSYIPYGDRYIFDNQLIPQGWHQLDSGQDAWYFGTWFNPRTLEFLEYAEGDIAEIKFESPQEFIGWVVGRKEVMAYECLDDWEQNWAVPIERDELEVYLSYVRADAIR